MKLVILLHWRILTLFLASRKTSYLPPNIPPRTYSLKPRTKTVEIEFNSMSLNSQSKELRDVDDDFAYSDCKRLGIFVYSNFK